MMPTTKRKPTRGGARKGAGRPIDPKTGAAAERLTLRLYPADTERIEWLRGQLGMGEESKANVVRRAVVVLFDDLQRPSRKLTRKECEETQRALMLVRGYRGSPDAIGDLARSAASALELLLNRLSELD